MEVPFLISILAAFLVRSNCIVPEDEILWVYEPELYTLKPENDRVDAKETLPILKKIQGFMIDNERILKHRDGIREMVVNLTDMEWSVLMNHPQIFELEMALEKANKRVEDVCRRDLEIRFRKVSEEIQLELSRLASNELDDLTRAQTLTLEELGELQRRIKNQSEMSKKESIECSNDESKCGFIDDLVTAAEFQLYVADQESRIRLQNVESKIWDLLNSEETFTLLSEKLKDPVEDCLHRFG